MVLTSLMVRFMASLFVLLLKVSPFSQASRLVLHLHSVHEASHHQHAASLRSPTAPFKVDLPLAPLHSHNSPTPSSFPPSFVPMGHSTGYSFGEGSKSRQHGAKVALGRGQPADATESSEVEDEERGEGAVSVMSGSSRVRSVAEVGDQVEGSRGDRMRPASWHS